ncbi:hypothetical protein [Acinetobacter sp. YH16032]|nr:hypothetical protein [Acinetobacter sp. YH16032]
MNGIQDISKLIIWSLIAVVVCYTFGWIDQTVFEKNVVGDALMWID